jgi:GT2 family glycosyltransferase
MKRLAVAGILVICVVPIVRGFARGRAARHLDRWQHQPEPDVWPSVSVIVPAWSERGTLEACLASLRRVDYPSYEVIVAAGGPDGTYELAQQITRSDGRMTVLRQRDEGGKNGAMNDAAGVARGDVLVFLDADSIVSRRWLKALVAALRCCERGNGYAASTGRFVPLQRTLISKTGEMSQTLEYQARGRVSLQGSGSVALRRTAWDAIGAIPEGVYADDWDLNARLRHARMRVSYAPDAIVCSEKPTSLAEWWQNELRWRRIHLASLFRIARAEMPDTLSAARSLYPYLVGWAVLALGAGVIASRRLSRKIAPAAEAGWVSLSAVAVAREVAGAVETAAFTGDLSWLQTVVVIPALTVLSWVAAIVATLSPGQTTVHFKGPRGQVSQAAVIPFAQQDAAGPNAATPLEPQSRVAA